MPGLEQLQFSNSLENLRGSPTMGPLFAMWAAQEQNNRALQQNQALESNQNKNLQDAITTRQMQALDNPADIDVLRRGKLGVARSQDATGRYDQGVVNSRIQAGNEENRSKITTAQTEQMLHSIDMAIAAIQTNPALGISVIPDEDLRAKVSQYAQKGIPPLKTLQTFSDKLKSNLANSPKFMADANLKAIEANAKIQEQALQNQGQLNVARIRSPGDDSRAARSEEAITVRANSALIANLQQENKTMAEEVARLEMTDPKGITSTTTLRKSQLATRIKENRDMMTEIRNNIKKDYVPSNVSSSPSPKGTKEIVTKSGKRVVVTSE